MSTLTVTKHINAPPEVVFDLMTDIPHHAENISAIERIEMLTDGPVGVGTRFRETRIMFGKETTEEMEVTGFQTPKRFTLESDSCGCHYTVLHELTPEKAGTLVKMEFHMQPKTFFAKLFSPLGKLMEGKIRSLLDTDLEELKERAEGAS
ncbi:SRPBCC family protein [Adhaeretor mobilis]|uniref:Polyketide cyclase / dehydrase and lipid transport n=1 Tax=Adhaeretor mobilis TaxID=1930276 RepID=A0A517MWY5_9BACT|nr:SRPBCC family protein [Adhaeretor mobilis]QDS99394.1 Polyketide cyclase / dehydrase and lipid transport [Adhaeretor mobilis]